MPLYGTGSSEPAAYILYWGLTTENPPVAGALREQPKGQDRPRKAGTGANAVVRHRLFGAIRLRDASATHPRQLHDGSATATRRLHDGSATATRRLHDSYTTAPRQLHDGSTTATRRLHDSYTTAPRQLHDGSTTATRRLHDSYTTATRRLHDYGAPEEKKKQEYIQSKNEVEVGGVILPYIFGHKCLLFPHLLPHFGTERQFALEPLN